jgi:chromosome partitioning protein
MPVIAIINRKGGSGKSTVAAHLAAWCARQGSAVMLGDVDRQQSSCAWLKRRDSALPAIAPWILDQSRLRVPSGITHVVLDTPGGLHGFELARVVMFADAIIMPVCNSMFDRESAAACYAELMTLPRVASGRCRLAVVGMRIDTRTGAAKSLAEWSASLGVPFLGVLRETQLYVRSLEHGLTIFDLSPKLVQPDLAQWAPILHWLKPQLYAPQAANDGNSRQRPVARTLVPQPVPVSPAAAAMSKQLGPMSDALKQTPESLVHGERLSAPSNSPAPTAPIQASVKPAATRPNWLTDGRYIPQFLRRGG